MIRGTRFIEQPLSLKITELKKYFTEIVNFFNYTELYLPLLSYQKNFDNDTQLLSKLFSFYDKKQRKIFLLPEQTLSIAFFYSCKKKEKKGERFFSFSPCFRYERPQKKRYRQFYQIGLENFSPLPLQEKREEILLIIIQFFKKLQGNFILKFNFIDKEIKEQYNSTILKFLLPISLCLFCQNKLKKNPIKIFDCKRQKCQTTFKKIKLNKKIIFSKKKQNQIINFIKNYSKNIEGQFDPFLVRGLNYYNGFIFEIFEKKEKAISLLGGGEYQKIIQKQKINGIGIAIGMDRILEYYQLKSKKSILLLLQKKKYTVVNYVFEQIKKKQLFNNYQFTFSFYKKNKKIIKNYSIINKKRDFDQLLEKLK